MMQIITARTQKLNEFMKERITLPNIITVNKEQVIDIGGEGSKLKYLQKYESKVPELKDEFYNLFVEQMFNTSYRLIGIAFDGQIEIVDETKYKLEYDENDHPILNGIDIFNEIGKYHNSITA